MVLDLLFGERQWNSQSGFKVVFHVTPGFHKASFRVSQNKTMKLIEIYELKIFIYTSAVNLEKNPTETKFLKPKIFYYSFKLTKPRGFVQ